MAYDNQQQESSHYWPFLLEILGTRFAFTINIHKLYQSLFVTDGQSRGVCENNQHFALLCIGPLVEDNDGDDDGDGEDNGDDVEDIDDVEDDDHLVLVDGFLLSLSSSLTLSPIKLLGPVARVARELREELLTKIIVNIDKLHNLFC